MKKLFLIAALIFPLEASPCHFRAILSEYSQQLHALADDLEEGLIHPLSRYFKALKSMQEKSLKACKKCQDKTTRSTEHTVEKIVAFLGH